MGKSLFVAIILVAAFADVYGGRRTCGTNKTWDSCPPVSKVYCNGPPVILYEEPCVGRCVCATGYTYESETSNTCIPNAECPVPTCDEPNMSYNYCGSRCPDYCGKPSGMSCAQVCTPGCFCDSGYILSNNASMPVCIPEGTCP